MSKPSASNSPSGPDSSSSPSEHYAPSGVDRSLIRWMLSLSPTERLLVVQQQVNAVRSLGVLSLSKYVELKEGSGQSKDRARLPVLRETLEMLREAENSERPDESE